MSKIFVMLGGVNAFLAVALGAFGAHGLKNRLSPDLLEIYHTGVTYHMYHALGLLAVGLLAHWLSETVLINWSGWMMLAGILLFSGSLYVLSLTGVRWLGAITPLGGIAFLIGWALLVLAAWKAG